MNCNRRAAGCLVAMLMLMLMLGVATAAGADHQLENRDIVAGQAHYAAHCAACHGLQLQGQPDWRQPGADGLLPAPPHDETGHTWHHDTQMLFDYTKLGGKAALAAQGLAFNSGMPGFDGVISDDAIWDILAYIRSTWPERVQQVQASRTPRH